MMQLHRTIESPRTNWETLRARYPGYTICGEKMGWHYPVHETKTVLVSIGWKSLVVDVKKHLEGNGKPVPSDLGRQMGAWYCREVSSEGCMEEDPRIREAQEIAGQIERFWNTMKDFVEAGGQPVPQEEANRRAAICAGCPRKEQESALCAACWMKGLISNVVNSTQGWETPLDKQLAGKSCGVCKCRLTTKVHIPLIEGETDVFAGQWPVEYPCWARPS